MGCSAAWSVQRSAVGKPCGKLQHHPAAPHGPPLASLAPPWLLLAPSYWLNLFCATYRHDIIALFLQFC